MLLYLLTQLGQVYLLLPSSVPKTVLEAEDDCLRKLRSYNVSLQSSLETDMLSDQLATWAQLQDIWHEMELIDVTAQDYVALRRGDVIDYDSLRECLKVDTTV